jgi:putative ABC transport system permease protein
MLTSAPITTSSQTMDTFAHDLRHAVRSLTGLRDVGLVAMATLALGIGATTTMFGVVDAALLRPPPFSDPDRLVMISQTRTAAREGPMTLRWSYPHILDLQEAVRQKPDTTGSPSFDAIASVTAPLLSTSGGGDPEQIDGEIVSPEYFRAMRVTPVAGRTFSIDESVSAQPVVVVSARVWRRRFASDPALVGRTLRVNDVSLTIIGILPDGFAGLSGKSDVWISPPMSARLAYAEYVTTPQHFISVVARLTDGVPLVHANAELAAIGGRFADTPSPPTTTWSAVAVPVAEARIDATVRNSALVLLAASACVLLIACVNVASLLLARARVRRREIAVRLAMGSSRARLVRQLLTEGLVLAAAAGAGGALLATASLRALARAAPAVMPTARNDYGAIAASGALGADHRVLFFAVAISVATTALFALAPALGASRPDLVPALKEDDRGGGRLSRTLGTLVVIEVALAVLLLTGSGLLIETFARIQNRRAGFTPDDVLTFWVRPPTSRYAYPADGPAIIGRLLERIQAVPGVESAAVNRCTPFTGCSRSVAFFPDRPIDPATAPGIGRHYISSDYFRTLGIPVLAGRALTPADRDGTPPVAVVNESGARRFWPGVNPIGQRVWFGTTTGPFANPARAVEIVGVVGDVKYEGVDQPDNPSRADFYTSYLQFSYPDTMVIVKTRGRAAEAVVPALRSAVAAVDAALPIYDVMTLDERIDAAIARPRFNAALLTAFAAAALLLAAIGVYGVLSYAVSSRMREIGIRLALGADGRRVVALVLGDGLRLAGIGAGVGTAAALGAARVLRRVLVGVAPADAGLLAGGVIVMLAASALAAYLPARRAAAIDPIVVLRNE